jgi:hypothetical protein
MGAKFTFLLQSAFTAYVARERERVRDVCMRAFIKIKIIWLVNLLSTKHLA